VSTIVFGLNAAKNRITTVPIPGGEEVWDLGEVPDSGVWGGKHSAQKIGSKKLELIRAGTQMNILYKRKGTRVRAFRAPKS